MLSLFLTEAGLRVQRIANVHIVVYRLYVYTGYVKLSDQLLKIEKALRHGDTCRPTGQNMRDSPADLASLFRVTS